MVDKIININFNGGKKIIKLNKQFDSFKLDLTSLLGINGEKLKLFYKDEDEDIILINTPEDYNQFLYQVENNQVLTMEVEEIKDKNIFPVNCSLCKEKIFKDVIYFCPKCEKQFKEKEDEYKKKIDEMAFKIKELEKEIEALKKPVSDEQYFQRTPYTGVSIVDGLEAIGANKTYAYRAQIAAKNGIIGYRGTAEQNTKMLNLLKEGKLLKP